MSKRWQLPTQKGTEVNPQVTRQPPKLVIPGIGGDHDLRARLISEYGGHLAQFHMKEMQRYALSTSGVQGGQRHLPDAKMTYWNNNGQETLRLEVAPEKLERVKKEPKSGTPWDWALIEWTIPDVGGVSRANFSAFLVSPVGYPILPGEEFPHRYVAKDWSGQDDGEVENRVIAYPPPTYDALPIETVSRDGTSQVSSLRVDLRPFVGVQTVGIDIYGYLDPPYRTDNVLSGSAYGGKQGRVDYTAAGDGPVTLNDQFTTLDLFREYFPEYGEPHYFDESPSYTDSYTFDGAASTAITVSGGVGSPDPNAIISTYLPTIGTFSPPEGGPATYEETYYSNGSVRTRRLRATRYTAGDLATTDNATVTLPSSDLATLAVADFTEFWAPTFSSESVYDGPIVRQCTITGRTLRGTPPWVYSESFGSVNYVQWELEDRYPERLPLPVLQRPVMIRDKIVPDDADVSIHTHFAMPYLGRLWIDRNTGGISFEPA